MDISKMKVSNRLALGFGMVLALLTITSVLGIYRMAQVQTALDRVVHNNVYKMRLVFEMSEAVDRMSRGMQTLILLSDPAGVEAEEKNITAARTKYESVQAALEKTVATETGKAIRGKVMKAMEAAMPLNAKVIEMAKNHYDVDATDLLFQQAAPAIQKWQDALRENIEFQRSENEKDATAAKKAYESGRTMMLVLSALAILLGTAAAVAIARSLSQQLGGEPDYAAEIAKRIAAGDLTIAVETRAGDRSSLLHSMKEMRDSLAKTVGEVRASTNTIAMASQELASGNQDLSSRTEQQASSLEETASSMEELTSTVKQNADNARQANGLAASASEVAVKGGAVVSQVVGTMASINESSKKIIDIIGVIDGIAFQTNILALNAAVEAARAGEQGRGFAVVAAEVRNLAQRSAAAAKEIKSLINDSVDKVDVGAKLVDQAGSTMKEIVDSVKRVTDIMGEIMAASQEQSSGIEQVNQAIVQLDQTTQENAALVEQAAAASEAMQEQAGKLAQAVNSFKLDGMHATDPMAATAVPRPRASTKPLTKRTATGIPASQPARLSRTRATADHEWEQF